MRPQHLTRDVVGVVGEEVSDCPWDGDSDGGQEDVEGEGGRGSLTQMMIGGDAGHRLPSIART